MPPSRITRPNLIWSLGAQCHYSVILQTTPSANYYISGRSLPNETHEEEFCLPSLFSLCLVSHQDQLWAATTPHARSLCSQRTDKRIQEGRKREERRQHILLKGPNGSMGARSACIACGDGARFPGICPSFLSSYHCERCAVLNHTKGCKWCTSCSRNLFFACLCSRQLFNSILHCINHGGVMRGVMIPLSIR